MEAQYITLNGFEDYEILSQHPFTIRRKKDGYIISEWFNNKGYVTIKLNQKSYKKHRIIAQQFIPNPNNLPQVDHINHNRADNRIENLRWITNQENCKNKSKQNGIEYVFIDELDENKSFEINRYGQLEFHNYYFNLVDEQFYLKTHDDMYRRLFINNDRGSEYVLMKDINGKTRKISINKFKRLYCIE
ncbi:HNH endonuclease signature motif containing protein [uncultured Brachyspira sp.]|uniref:HNH endonuclease signature motif containing protein n=1 Tax=uncultured Brachyspira sp. TaxID=221953 RepID=UPI0025DBA760|nr:HNH endonuclease signature motif containing protein [uncultured Brachyspira sp.]